MKWAGRGRTIAMAACIMTSAVLIAGCAKTDVITDFDGNVLNYPRHTAKTRAADHHGTYGQSPAVSQTSEPAGGAGAHGATPTPTAGPDSPAS